MSNEYHDYRLIFLINFIKEMVTGKALFPGHSDEDQLDMIFSKIGTPNEDIYQDLDNLPDWKVFDYFLELLNNLNKYSLKTFQITRANH